MSSFTILKESPTTCCVAFSIKEPDRTVHICRSLAHHSYIKFIPYRDNLLGLDSRRGQGFFFSSPQRPDRPWGRFSLMSSGQRVWSDCSVKLTTYLHVMPKLRIRGTVPPLPICLHGVVAWYLVKHKDNFTSTFYVTEKTAARNAVCLNCLLIM
jgi:hypothetical protein